MLCGLKKLKISFHIINILCALCAFAVIYIGAELTIYLSSIPHVDYAAIIKVTNVLIILGSILFIISFFGCVGACRESYCMIRAYSVCLAFLLIAHLYVIHDFYIQQSKGLRPAVTSFNDMFDQRNTNVTEMEGVFYVQKSLKCCGKKNFSDWGEVVPESCKDEDEKVFQIGCELALSEYIEDHISCAVNLAFLMAIAEVMTVITTGYLAFGIRQEEENCGKLNVKRKKLRTVSI